MWKYIVTWIIVKASMADCPIKESGVSYDSTTLKKSFNSRKEAIEFIKGGESHGGRNETDFFMDGGRPVSFKIDSIKNKR